MTISRVSKKVNKTIPGISGLRMRSHAFTVCFLPRFVLSSGKCLTLKQTTEINLPFLSIFTIHACKAFRTLWKKNETCRLVTPKHSTRVCLYHCKARQPHRGISTTCEMFYRIQLFNLGDDFAVIIINLLQIQLGNENGTRWKNFSTLLGGKKIFGIFPRPTN